MRAVKGIKYYKDVIENDITLINEDGVVTSECGGNGWVIYGNPSEFYRLLNSKIDTTYPRWQTSSPDVYAYFKTPKRGIIKSYLTTQWVDENGMWSGRMCNHWILTGYKTEKDMLNLSNGTILDENSWDSFISNGTNKTVDLSSNMNCFQYYTLQMVSNLEGSTGYTSMGNTKFYMQVSNPVKVTSTDNYDFNIDVFELPKVEEKRYAIRS